MSGLKFPKEETKKKRMSHPASILGSRKGRCYMCSRCGQTQEHHIFGGPNRTLSEKYGLEVVKQNKWRTICTPLQERDRYE